MLHVCYSHPANEKQPCTQVNLYWIVTKVWALKSGLLHPFRGIVWQASACQSTQTRTSCFKLQTVPLEFPHYPNTVWRFSQAWLKTREQILFYQVIFNEIPQRKGPEDIIWKLLVSEQSVQDLSGSKSILIILWTSDDLTIRFSNIKCNLFVYFRH